MVLNAGITNVINLLRGNSSGKKFTKIVVGTGNAVVTGNESALTGQLAKDISTVDDLGGGFVQFNSELTAADPAMLISEMGILNEDGVLCYRQVITAQNKVAGVTYSLSYKIRVQ